MIDRIFHDPCRLRSEVGRHQAQRHTKRPTMGSCLDRGACLADIGVACNTSSKSRLNGLTGEQLLLCSLWETIERCFDF
eukprot:scaffold656_cov403-Pavlova_lutheri.AAC.22